MCGPSTWVPLEMHRQGALHGSIGLSVAVLMTQISQVANLCHSPAGLDERLNEFCTDQSCKQAMRLQNCISSVSGWALCGLSLKLHQRHGTCQVH